MELLLSNFEEASCRMSQRIWVLLTVRHDGRYQVSLPLHLNPLYPYISNIDYYHLPLLKDIRTRIYLALLGFQIGSINVDR